MSPEPDAASYLHGHHRSVLRSHAWRNADNSAAYLLDRLSEGDRILDVGCGPGTITVDFARRVQTGYVVGLDDAQDVISAAREEAARASVKNVDFQVGDVYQLPFDSQSFDVVHAHQVCQHLADPVAAIAEMRRVCRRGGVVAVRDSDFGGMFWAPDVEGMEEWRALYCEVAAASGGDPKGGRHLPIWADQAGFSDVTVTASSWCFRTPAETAWWGGLWADRITQSRLADQAISSGRADMATLERLARAWRTWSGDPRALFIAPHVELLCVA